MKNLLLLISLAFLGISTKSSAQVEPRITLNGWYEVLGLDVNVAFGKEQKHAAELGLLAESRPYSVYYALELMYHYELARAGNGSLLAGLGMRTYSFDDFSGGIILPFTYRYRFPEQPFAVRARLTNVFGGVRFYALPSLGVSYIF